MADEDSVMLNDLLTSFDPPTASTPTPPATTATGSTNAVPPAYQHSNPVSSSFLFPDFGEHALQGEQRDVQGAGIEQGPQEGNRHGMGQKAQQQALADLQQHQQQMAASAAVSQPAGQAGTPASMSNGLMEGMQGAFGSFAGFRNAHHTPGTGSSAFMSDAGSYTDTDLLFTPLMSPAMTPLSVISAASSAPGMRSIGPLPLSAFPLSASTSASSGHQTSGPSHPHSSHSSSGHFASAPSSAPGPSSGSGPSVAPSELFSPLTSPALHPQGYIGHHHHNGSTSSLNGQQDASLMLPQHLMQHQMHGYSAASGQSAALLQALTARNGTPSASQLPTPALQALLAQAAQLGFSSPGNLDLQTLASSLQSPQTPSATHYQHLMFPPPGPGSPGHPTTGLSAEQVQAQQAFIQAQLQAHAQAQSQALALTYAFPGLNMGTPHMGPLSDAALAAHGLAQPSPHSMAHMALAPGSTAPPATPIYFQTTGQGSMPASPALAPNMDGGRVGREGSGGNATGKVGRRGSKAAKSRPSPIIRPTDREKSERKSRPRAGSITSLPSTNEAGGSGSARHSRDPSRNSLHPISTSGTASSPRNGGPMSASTSPGRQSSQASPVVVPTVGNYSNGAAQPQGSVKSAASASGTNSPSPVNLDQQAQAASAAAAIAVSGQSAAPVTTPLAAAAANKISPVTPASIMNLPSEFGLLAGLHAAAVGGASSTGAPPPSDLAAGVGSMTPMTKARGVRNESASSSAQVSPMLLPADRAPSNGTPSMMKNSAGERKRKLSMAPAGPSQSPRMGPAASGSTNGQMPGRRRAANLGGLNGALNRGKAVEAAVLARRSGAQEATSPALKPILPSGHAPDALAHLSQKSNYHHIMDGRGVDLLGLDPKTVHALHDSHAAGAESRRTNHKAAEQKRRDSLKHCFDDLRRILPPVPSDDDDGMILKRPGEGAVGGVRSGRDDPENPNRHVSKVALLRRSNEYIVALHSRMDRRDAAIDVLRGRIRALRSRMGEDLDEDDELDGIGFGDLDEGEPFFVDVAGFRNPALGNAGPVAAGLSGSGFTTPRMLPTMGPSPSTSGRSGTTKSSAAKAKAEDMEEDEDDTEEASHRSSKGSMRSGPPVMPTRRSSRTTAGGNTKTGLDEGYDEDEDDDEEEGNDDDGDDEFKPPPSVAGRKGTRTRARKGGGGDEEKDKAGLTVEDGLDALGTDAGQRVATRSMSKRDDDAMDVEAG